MELQTTLDRYNETNCYMDVDPDGSNYIVRAVSYKWWCFIATDSVGNIFFNDHNYSHSTSTHQLSARSILRNLGVHINLTIRLTEDHFGPSVSDSSIKSCILSEIDRHREEIVSLIEAIRKKGSWKKVNKQRRSAIKKHLTKIKTLRSIKNDYIGKRKIPTKKLSFRDLCHAKDPAGNFRHFFLNSKGRFNKHGYTSFLRRSTYNCTYYFDSYYRSWSHKPRHEEWSIDKIKDLLNLKATDSIDPILLYAFSKDLNGMIPEKDSKEHVQLIKWLKRREISRDNLNTLNLDKIHTYLTNKVNRKNYIPSEPTYFRLSKDLLKLDGIEHLKLIKTDKDLRAEGRKQSHCIGSKPYMDKCKNGYQALNYKGHTFFLDPKNQILEAHGSCNRHTPFELRLELQTLIKSEVA